MEKLKIGDNVMWRGGFGSDAPKPAKVTGIEKCAEGKKNGETIFSVPWDKVDSRKIVVDLDNGHWAYGTQISQMKK